MELAISDTTVFPVDLLKIQSGDPYEFQKLYRKFYDRLLDEAALLLNDRAQSIALVQLSCIQSWVHCEDITSEEYYFGYARSRVLRYAQIGSSKDQRLNHELAVLSEILANQYELTLYHLDNLYATLSLSQKDLIRKAFRSYFQPGPHVAYSQTLLNHAFFILHYMLT